MKCHYEVLEISREADDGEIKTAYRKLALKWHPDKNLDDPDLAKEQFQIVQQAYEVLSDKQERAWYDAHRDQILRGANSEFVDKSLDLFQYFTTTCFKGYSDDDGGFYTVYRNVFQQISKEDIEFVDDKEEFCEMPDFGKSNTDYESVKRFYDYWSSYSTKKTYSWLDPYDVREGKGDRRLLKIIDKENKKARIKAKKERNDEVRNLVAFVRKRDKRMQAFKKEMEAKALENRRKQEEISKQKRLERNRLHANEKEADWLKFDNVRSELERIERHLAEEFGEEESDEEDYSTLYCIACNKVFKNPKAFENHEMSKKHKENVEKIKESMLEDDMDGYNDLKGSDEDLDYLIGASEDVSGEDSIADEENLLEIKDVVNECNTSVKKGKKKKKASTSTTQPTEAFDTAKACNDDDFNFISPTKNQKKKRKKGNTNKANFTKVENVEAHKAETKKPAMKDKKMVQVDVSNIDLSHCCVTCKNNFSSKNKLFEHLKKTNHGVYLAKN